MRESQIVSGWMAVAKRADILRALQLRFGLPVPEDVKAAVEKVTTLRELDQWFDASQTSASLDEFRSAVASNGVAVH